MLSNKHRFVDLAKDVLLLEKELGFRVIVEFRCDGLVDKFERFPFLLKLGLDILIVLGDLFVSSLDALLELSN